MKIYGQLTAQHYAEAAKAIDASIESLIGHLCRGNTGQCVPGALAGRVADRDALRRLGALAVEIETK